MGKVIQYVVLLFISHLVISTAMHLFWGMFIPGPASQNIGVASFLVSIFVARWLYRMKRREVSATD